MLACACVGRGVVGCCALCVVVVRWCTGYRLFWCVLRVFVLLCVGCCTCSLLFDCVWLLVRVGCVLLFDVVRCCCWLCVGAACW